MFSVLVGSDGRLHVTVSCLRWLEANLPGWATHIGLMTAGRLHGSALTSRSSAAGRTVRGKVHTLVFTPMQLTAFPDTFIFLTQYTSQVFWAMQYFIKAFILLHMLSFQDIKLLFRCTCMSGSACAAFPPNLPAIVGLSRRVPESQSLSERLVIVEACNAHLTFFWGGGSLKSK